MPIVRFTNEQKFGAPLNHERYDLLLIKGELIIEGRWPLLLPLIDRRLAEVELERERLGLSASDPAQYADAVRDGEEEIAEIAAQLNRDQEDRI